MSSSFLERALVEEEAFRYAFTNAILSRLPDVPVKLIKSPGSKSHRHKPDTGKGTLHLLPYKGEFLKPCPGTKEYICCGYQILNVAADCPLDCSYCILQSYFNQPYLRVFVNLHEEIEHVLQVIDRDSDRIYRIGTGEFTDSLALDPFTRWSDLLLPLFSKRKNAVLEVKTKTTRVENLLASNCKDRIVVSWSLNSRFIAEREEHGAASIKKRLEAARRCQSEGFVVGFHFDPLILHRGWKEEYLNTLELMERYIDPKGVMWISLGSFRFMPRLKQIIRKRHPETCVLDGEFVLGLDRKMRYFKPIRIDLYAFVRENLKKWYPDLCLYLCMESDEVWHKSLGWSPKNSQGLCHYLDRRVVEIFG